MRREPWWDRTALTAARAGSAAILEVLAGGALESGHKSGLHDVVTSADLASEQAVLAAIRAERPDDTIVAEESGEHPGTTGFRWLIDPLDGTANFVHGRADFAVSVGLEHEGVPVAGAVVKPATGQWASTSDSGLDADPLGALHGLAPAMASGDLAAALIAVGLPYSLVERRRVLESLAELIPSVGGIRMMGSAAADLLAVATGSLDGFLGFGLAPWDVAAGQALVEAAGGTVRRLDNGLFLAGSPAVVAGLESRLRPT